MKRGSRKINGFTLIELMVALTIVAIISGISIFGLTSIRQKAQDTAHLSGLRDTQLSLEAYKSVNGKYPDAGTQGTATYITGLAPTFISKLQVDNPLSAGSGYQYTVSADKKTYCLYIKNTINKPESQPDLYVVSCPKSWVACKGTQVSTVTTCAGAVAS